MARFPEAESVHFAHNFFGCWRRCEGNSSELMIEIEPTGRERTVNAYKTYAGIDASGHMLIENLPFPKGMLLEVLLVDQGSRPNERAASWQVLMRQVQALPQSKDISEEDIAREIDEVRGIR